MQSEPPVEELIELEDDISAAWTTIDDLVDGFFAALPNIVIALIVFILFWFLASASRRIVVAFTRERQRANFGKALGRLLYVLLLFLGLLLAVSIVAPSIGGAELLQLLGIGSVAIGFAFREILQNFLAGLIILLREPFREGDRVIFGNYEGTVEEISTRATHIRTYQGNRIIVPNGEIFTNPITVLTAFPEVRNHYDFGIGYGEDLGRAIEIIGKAVHSVPGVLKEPAPQILVQDLGASTVAVRALWWTENERAMAVRSVVLKTVKETADRVGLDMPFPTEVRLIENNDEGPEEPAGAAAKAV